MHYLVLIFFCRTYLNFSVGVQSILFFFIDIKNKCFHLARVRRGRPRGCMPASSRVASDLKFVSAYIKFEMDAYTMINHLLFVKFCFLFSLFIKRALTYFLTWASVYYLSFDQIWCSSQLYTYYIIHFTTLCKMNSQRSISNKMCIYR